MPTMTDRIADIASRCRTEPQVLRLWNWIDHQPAPEPLWHAMWNAAPISAGEMSVWLQNQRRLLMTTHGTTRNFR